MARRPMPVGTYGKINSRKAGKQWVADTRYRDRTGELRRMERTGRTKTDAEHRLKVDLGKVCEEIRGTTISGDTRLKRVAELWLQSIREETAAGAFAANTPRNYGSYVNNWIVPAMGSLVIGSEVTVAACEGLVKKVRAKKSLDAAKSCRSVLSSICGFAVRHGAMSVNPVKSIDKLRAGENDRKEIVAMSKEQRVDLREKLQVFAQAKQTDKRGRGIGRRGQVWLDLPDLVDAMLATGVRIGEIMAVSGDDVDIHNRKVSFNHHIERVPGKGLVRKKGRKGNEPGVTLIVPEWSMAMWRRRKLASGGGPLFATWNGLLLDPSTLIHRIREALDACGYDWVTSHVWRKTVSDVMQEAGLPTNAIADQLGNSERVVQKHYRPIRSVNPAAAAALETMF